MRQSIGGPGIMGDQVEEDESGVGGLIPYELLPDDKQTGNHGVIVIDGRELTAHQTSRLASQCGSVRMCNKETRSDMNPESLQACSRAVMGYVLPKTHKLCLPSLQSIDLSCTMSIMNFVCLPPFLSFIL